MLNDDGFKKIHRSIKKQPWWQNPYTSHLFVHLLLSATYTTLERLIDGHLVKLQKGSYWTTLARLSRETGLSIQRVRKSLTTLKSTHQITCDIYKQGTVITLNNWCKFEKETQQLTSEQHVSNTRATREQHYNKNEENEENIKDEPKNPTKEFINAFRDEYQLRFKQKYIVHWAKDRSLLSQPVRLYGSQALTGVLKAFFENAWVKEKGAYSLGAFVSLLPTLMATNKKEDRPKKFRGEDGKIYDAAGRVIEDIF